MSSTGSQREAYQPPAAGSSGVGRSYVPAPAGTMFYLCAECGVKVGINKGEPIRCKECGHRILYKQRTTRYLKSNPLSRDDSSNLDYPASSMVQFEAR